MARILFIDDDRLIRTIGRDALLAAGHEVLCAANGLEAREAITTRCFDLVITDIYMPEIDGYEIIQLVRQRCPGTPIITQSAGSLGSSTQSLKVAAMLGSDACLEKPYTPGYLVAIVEAILAEKDCVARPQAG